MRIALHLVPGAQRTAQNAENAKVAKKAPQGRVRPDRAGPGIDPALAIGNAPEAVDTAFVVPKVIEGEEEG